jgi:hypothetical protein
VSSGLPTDAGEPHRIRLFAIVAYTQSGTYGPVQLGQGEPVQLAGLWDLDRIGDADSHTTDLD